jgi:hypothetical protein
MINDCPKDYGDQIIIDKCQLFGINNKQEQDYYYYSYHFDIPIHSFLTSQVYANIFCAMCNQDFNNITKGLKPRSSDFVG